ncbi:hypothetical protein ILUMI_07614 [Ignelater luminosus]|uniref:Protein with SprT-like domain at the N terminus n=1 Tax=Ignelater luminosus TaxID=2038154 RepID=A0A8K0GHU7_IGNLU|nr:hypothetical protein ILUMI_07614 [Ignelater luminosus]
MSYDHYQIPFARPQSEQASYIGNLVLDLSTKKPPDNNRKDTNDTKSPADSSGEVIQIKPLQELIRPTSDVHKLFMAFNKKYFCDKLSAVRLSWSKQLTACAGFCVVKRDGICLITLNWPLLKRSPKKDLVQTLLHEMIHAYLLIVHNNYEHGPEFQKHMHRINAETGTNITLELHKFPDEVRLYRPHWWRCIGRCQKWKPYFGMVRRATNRPPGPNDCWWKQHQDTCGGKFIKIREPNKPQNKDKPAIPNDDIDKLVPVQMELPPFINLTGKDPVLGTSQPRDNSNYAAVRNHWINKFSSPQNVAATPNKRSSNNDPSISEISPKRVKPASPNDIQTSSDLVKCPVCEKSVSEAEINSHLDQCLQNQTVRSSTKDLTSNCPIGTVKLNEPVQTCVNSSDEFKPTDSESVPCLACNKKIIKSELNVHLEECMGCKNIFNSISDDVTEEEDDSLKDEAHKNTYNCPACYLWFTDHEINSHLDRCLLADSSLDRSLICSFSKDSS